MDVHTVASDSGGLAIFVRGAAPARRPLVGEGGSELAAEGGKGGARSSPRREIGEGCVQGIARREAGEGRGSRREAGEGRRRARCGGRKGRAAWLTRRGMQGGAARLAGGGARGSLRGEAASRGGVARP